jgi:hypothetical protein
MIATINTAIADTEAYSAGPIDYKTANIIAQHIGVHGGTVVAPSFSATSLGMPVQHHRGVGLCPARIDRLIDAYPPCTITSVIIEEGGEHERLQADGR